MSADKNMITVATSFRSYGFGKATYSNAPDGVRFVRGWDFPIQRYTDNDAIINNHLFFGPPGTDLYHVWNGIVANRHPWVVSYESVMPRYGNVDPNGFLYRWAVKRLKSPDCKAIFHVSEAARRGIVKLPWFDETIEKKLRLMSFAVPKIDIAKAEKPAGEFRLLFIGHEFFRKGGPMMVAAFEELSQRYPQLRLTLISRLDHHDYLTKTGPERAAEYRKRIEGNPKITLIHQIPNEKILREIMPSSHLFVFPTLDETFGLVVMEAMAAGTPVLSTAVRAIPEIVADGVEGELIRIPVDHRGIITEYNREVEELVTKELIRLLPDFITNPDKLRSMSEKALLKWKNKFSSEVRAAELKNAYMEILKR